MPDPRASLLSGIAAVKPKHCKQRCCQMLKVSGRNADREPETQDAQPADVAHGRAQSKPAAWEHTSKHVRCHPHRIMLLSWRAARRGTLKIEDGGPRTL